MIIQSAIIICIGDELLIGQTIDTNSAKIAQQLQALGIQIIRKYAISDTASEIFKSLDQSIPDADLVIITGGLGPTKDDITKQSLNQYFGGTLKRDPEVLAHVQAFFDLRKREMLPTNAQQADLPDVCEKIYNRVGTAPGMLFKKEGKWIVSLPGVPREVDVILKEVLIPVIKSQAISKSHIIHRNLILFGRGESFVANDIEAIENALPAHISLSYLPAYGELKLRLTGKGEDAETLNKEIDAITDAIKAIEAEYIIAEADVSMETIIVDLLKAQNQTVSFAESCTGGLVSSKITDVPGASQVYFGSVISYDNSIKEHELGVDQKVLQEYGAVSEQTVTIMANAVRKKMKTDFGVAISGILGPSGGSETKPVGLVYFAVASPNGTHAFHFNFPYERITNKEVAVKTALNLLRKAILAQ